MRKTIVLAAVLGAVMLAGCTQQAAETPSAPSAAPPAYRIYVTNETSNDISVIDSATNQVVATVPVGKRPRGARLSPDGKFLYIALSGSPLALHLLAHPPVGPRRGCGGGAHEALRSGWASTSSIVVPSCSHA